MEIPRLGAPIWPSCHYVNYHLCIPLEFSRFGQRQGFAINASC